MRRRTFLKNIVVGSVVSMLPNFSFANKKNIRVGVVSDLEGAFISDFKRGLKNNIKLSVSKLKKQKVDLIIIAGDVYENEQIRGKNSLYKRSVNNLQEMVLGIKPYAELGVPVYVISGNHEVSDIFNSGIDKLNSMGLNNVFNINNSFLDLDLFSIVSIGGYHHPKFTAKGAKLIGKSDYNLLYSNFTKALNLHKPIIFLSHGPPKTSSEVDKINSGYNVGDENFTNLMLHPQLKNVIHVFGHIHEAGGSFFNFAPDKVSVNVSAITDFNSDKKVRACVIDIEDNKYSWKFI